jgi:hypothetical protein
MPREFTLGKATTQRRKQSSCYVGVTLKPAVYERLCRMRDALQRELGPDQNVTIASVVRRILYQHPSLRKLAVRHYTPEEQPAEIEL